MNVKGRIVYLFGEDIENVEDYKLNLLIQVEAIQRAAEESLHESSMVSFVFVL